MVETTSVTVQYEIRIREIIAQKRRGSWIYNAFANWGELLGLSTNAVFEDALDKAIGSQYEGKPLSELPEKITITLPSAADLPKPWEPFAFILPGIPNPFIDPVTGQADPLGQLFGAGTALGSILGFLGFLFSVQGLAMIAGAILLYVGYKSMMGSGSSGT